MPESARDRCLVSVSGRRASAQVWHAAQAQAISDFSKPLPARSKEAAEETPLAQLLQPRLPGLGGCAQPLIEVCSLVSGTSAIPAAKGFRSSSIPCGCFPL